MNFTSIINGVATFEATGDLHLYAIVCTNSLDSVYAIPLHPRSKGLHCGGGGGGGGGGGTEPVHLVQTPSSTTCSIQSKKHLGTLGTYLKVFR